MPAPPIISGTRTAQKLAVGVAASASQRTPDAWRASPLTISGREPIRSLSSPATGATNIGISVHGSVSRPACSGVWPCATWKYWASRKIDPKTPKNIASETALVALKARERNSDIGSIGCAARRS